MKILVTGGAGYIGSHTCKLLSQQGYKPIVYDSLVYGHEWAVKWGPFYKGDIQNGDFLREVIRKEKIEAVIHFAAFAYVGESVEKPNLYYQNNVMGTLSLLEAMRAEGVKKIVFSSTCATYGTPEIIPIPETIPQNPINPYGRSKLMVEEILKDYVKAYKFEATALRYFNASGADLDGEIGEDHNPETHLIPLTIRAALVPKKSISVFGSDYPTVDGTCIRDYIHVTDLAEAHILALKKLKNEFQFFNLGTGKGISVKEIIQMTEKITGQKIEVKLAPRREGDPAELIANGVKAKNNLGWIPKHSDIETIITTATNWHKKHHL